MGTMKTTVDIHDELLARAKRLAKKSNRSLRAVVEEGLRRVLDAPASRHEYKMSDLSVGNPENADPLEMYSWQDLRAIIYGDPGTR